MRLPLPATMLLTCLVSGCQERWDGWAYPDRNNLGDAYPLGQFSTLPDCRQAARAFLAGARTLTGDYECGRNCKLSSDPAAPAVCEVTVR